MVLTILYAISSSFLASQHLPPAILVAVLALCAYAFAQGRTTNRERDLHARTIILTGGFTPFGLPLIQALAQRGAHIIALSPEPIHSPHISLIIDLLRSTTKNEHIFAEQCNLTSPSSVKSFCTQFLTGTDHRLDALVFAHEYQPLRSLFASTDHPAVEKRRLHASLATFLITTLLLPVLLVAPIERDIRIVNVVNPFYAAAASSFSPKLSPPPPTSLLVQEGNRALRMIVLTRHLQRVLDSLPSRGQVPKTGAEGPVEVVSEKAQKSNIVAVSVCPGISRSDTIAPLLGAHRTAPPPHRSTIGLILYILLQPLLRICTKGSSAAIQSALHVLFLPTPFKSLRNKPSSVRVRENDDLPNEVLKAGGLYRECAVVTMKLPSTQPVEIEQTQSSDKKEEAGGQPADDGEWGGVNLGQAVWEEFEQGLKAWERESADEEKATDRGHHSHPQGPS